MENIFFKAVMKHWTEPQSRIYMLRAQKDGAGSNVRLAVSMKLSRQCCLTRSTCVDDVLCCSADMVENICPDAQDICVFIMVILRNADNRGKSVDG